MVKIDELKDVWSDLSEFEQPADLSIQDDMSSVIKLITDNNNRKIDYYTKLAQHRPKALAEKASIEKNIEFLKDHYQKIINKYLAVGEIPSDHKKNKDLMTSYVVNVLAKEELEKESIDKKIMDLQKKLKATVDLLGEINERLGILEITIKCNVATLRALEK